MDHSAITPVLEAALFAAGKPLSVDELHRVFPWGERPDKKIIREALAGLAEAYQDRGVELIEVASGFRVQVPARFAANLEALHEERPPRYSRALLETLALIAYRQPITRGEIEEVRGVAVSPNIIRTLLEREWIRSVGHRDVPGRPEMFGTTKTFLDYFNLKRLDDLPTLSELTDIESLQVQLDLPTVESQIVSEADDGIADIAAANNADAPAAEASVDAADDVAAGDPPDEVSAANVEPQHDNIDSGAGDDAANDPADSASATEVEPQHEGTAPDAGDTVIIVSDDARSAIAGDDADGTPAEDGAAAGAMGDTNAANR